MFQFVTYHNDDSFQTLTEMVETIQEFELSVVETYPTEWDETALVIQGTREQFEKLFLSESDPSQSTNIDEFMDELEEVA